MYGITSNSTVPSCVSMLNLVSQLPHTTLLCCYLASMLKYQNSFKSKILFLNSEIYYMYRPLVSKSHVIIEEAASRYSRHDSQIFQIFSRYVDNHGIGFDSLIEVQPMSTTQVVPFTCYCCRYVLFIKFLEAQLLSTTQVFNRLAVPRRPLVLIVVQ